MRKVLFLSPHLDDAVFSCAIRILREKETGADVTVATVFSHVRRGSPQSKDYVIRRQEDRAALGELGARSRWLGLLDAPSRDSFYNSFRRIVLETAASDRAYLALLKKRLKDFIDRFAPDVIYVPLAVGTHIDHRLVFDAVTSLHLSCPQIFYEDQPYALVESAARSRLAEIGAMIPRSKTEPATGSQPISSQEVTRFIRSFRRAPYVQQYLPPGPERISVEKIVRNRFYLPGKKLAWRLESKLESLSPADHARVRRSLMAYRSQARIFLGTPHKFSTDSLRHAKSLGVGRDRGERYWKRAENKRPSRRHRVTHT